MSALDDQSGCRDHAVGALPARELGIFLDSVERHFGGAAENGKHRAVFQKINCVIAPFAGRDHAAIESENAVELAPAECHLPGDDGRNTALAPAMLARFGFAESHAAPPLSDCRMIAPSRNSRKGSRCDMTCK